MKLSYHWLLLLLGVSAMVPNMAIAQVTANAVLNTIISGRTGPIPDADIILIGLGEVSGTRYQVKTDTEGSTELKCLPGNYLITIGKAGYIPVVDEVVLVEKRVVSKVFILETKVDARLDPTLSTATRTDEYASEAPATSYVVSEIQIRDRGYMNLQDVLNDLPEVFVFNNVNPETKDLVTSRGVLGNEKFLILQDGIQISAASGDPNTIGYNYPVTSAKQVEIILGPASALYGADAYAGVINLITNTGNEAPLNIRATSSYGRFNTFDNALTLNARVGTARIFANGNYYTSTETPFWKFYPNEFGHYAGGIADTTMQNIGGATPTSTLPANISREYETPSLGYSVHAGVVWKSLEAGFSYRRVEHSSSLGDRPEWSVYEERAELDNYNQSIYLKHTLKSASQKWGLTSLVWHNTNFLADGTSSAFINTFSNYGIAYKYNRANVTRITEQLNVALSKTLNLNLGGQFERVNAIPLTADLPAPYDNSLAPEQQNMTYPGTNVVIPFFVLQYNNVGANAQLRYTSASKVVDITLGGRYDNSTRYGGSFSPRAGIVLRPLARRDQLTLKVMYGEGFLSPSPWKAYANYGPVFKNDTGAVVSPFYHMPNPQLQPEKLRSLEISAIYRPVQNTLFAVDAFANRITNRILVNGTFDNLTNPVAPIDSFAGITFTGVVEIPANVGLSQTLGATLRWNSLFTLTSGADLEAFAAATFLDGSYSSSDSVTSQALWTNRHNGSSKGIYNLASTPVFSLKGGFTLTIQRLAISPRFQWIGHMSGEVVSSGDTNGNGYGENALGEDYYSPSYFVVNLFARYEVVKAQKFGIRAFVRANNLLDARYYNPYYGGVRGLSRVPQDPFRWAVGFTVDLH